MDQSGPADPSVVARHGLGHKLEIVSPRIAVIKRKDLLLTFASTQSLAPQLFISVGAPMLHAGL